MMINIITFLGIGFWSLLSVFKYLFNIGNVIDKYYSKPRSKLGYNNTKLELIFVRTLLCAFTFLFIVRIFIFIIIISTNKWAPISFFTWYLSFNFIGHTKQVEKDIEWTKEHRMTLLDIKMKFIKKDIT